MSTTIQYMYLVSTRTRQTMSYYQQYNYTHTHHNTNCNLPPPLPHAHRHSLVLVFLTDRVQETVMVLYSLSCPPIRGSGYVSVRGLIGGWRTALVWVYGFLAFEDHRLSEGSTSDRTSHSWLLFKSPGVGPTTRSTSQSSSALMEARQEDESAHHTLQRYPGQN